MIKAFGIITCFQPTCTITCSANQTKQKLTPPKFFIGGNLPCNVHITPCVYSGPKCTCPSKVENCSWIEVVLVPKGLQKFGKMVSVWLKSPDAEFRCNPFIARRLCNYETIPLRSGKSRCDSNGRRYFSRETWSRLPATSAAFSSASAHWDLT